MSTMAATDRPRRPRRQFTDEFKAGAVGLVLDEGKSVGQVARELDLTESALRTWVERGRADRTKGRTGLTTEERAVVGDAGRRVLARRGPAVADALSGPVRRDSGYELAFYGAEDLTPSDFCI